MSDQITIEIDGHPYQADKGEMLIEVADRNSIRIPRFCYHKKLTVAANCRMCLVEVERAPKPLPACATPVMDGMKVMTHSALARRAQKSVMEFLLINHPLDCPICDQGGECELQDVAMGYGRDVSRFVERKRVVADKNLGPLISTDMTRCIHCTRCVRFGEEFAGVPELGMTGRGENVQIGTFIEQNIDSELSGNVIDLCPVGALTNKPFRFQARSWEMQQHAVVSPHDGVGANMYVHVSRGRVMRAVPRENEAVNEVWLADRDRYSHTGLYSDDRLAAPMIRDNGQWRECDWSEALEHTTRALQKIIAEHGADALGALGSSSASVEELYLLQKLMRGIGCGNIDHRLRQSDFSDQDQFPTAPGLGMGIVELQSMDAVLLVGSNARKEQPLLNHRLRKAMINGGAMMTLNPMDYGFNYPLAEQVIAGPGQYAARLQELAKSNGQMESVAARLKDAQNAVILLGPGVLNHPDAAYLRALADAAASACGARLGLLTDGGNPCGAWLAGAVPHRSSGGEVATVRGLDAAAMLAAPRKAYVLLGVEPELDCANSAQASAAMDAAEFVVAVTAYDSPRLRDSAHVLLPMALFAETAGTWVNMSGLWQSATGAVTPFGQARPAWKVLRVLGNLLDLAGFDYDDAFEIRDQLTEQCAQVAYNDTGTWPRRDSQLNTLKAEQATTIFRIGDVPAYAVDALVRRAAPLQDTADASFDGLQIGPELARNLGLSDGQRARVSQQDASTCVSVEGAEAVFTVKIVDSMAPGCVRLPSGIASTIGLGSSHGGADISAV